MDRDQVSDEVRRSRLLISRRRALSLGGSIGLGSLLAACGDSTARGGTASASASAPLTPTTTATGDIVAALDAARTCSTFPEQTQGPYWFDVDSIRTDIREERPGTVLQLALRVQDVSACSSDGRATPVSNCVVEIWHCDAGGLYSGFESGSPGAGGASNRRGAATTSNGSYAAGDQEATTTDDGTYLRGAQVADSNGIVQFTTIFPGWYPGRSPHIHLKVHLSRETVLTSQMYVEDDLATQVYAASPYSDRSGRRTANSDDGFFSDQGILTVRKEGGGYLGLINLGIDV